MADAPPSYDDALAGFVPVDHVPTSAIYRLPPVDPARNFSPGAQQTNSISVQPANGTKFSRSDVSPVVPAASLTPTAPPAAPPKPKSAPKPAPKPAPAPKPTRSPNTQGIQITEIEDPLEPDDVTTDDKRNVLIAKIYRVYLVQFVLYGGLCALACYINGMQEFFRGEAGTVILYISGGLIVYNGLFVYINMRQRHNGCQQKGNHCAIVQLVILSVALAMGLMALAGYFYARGMIVGCGGIVVMLFISQSIHLTKRSMTEKQSYITSLILCIIVSGASVLVTYFMIDRSVDMRSEWPQLCPAPVMILVCVMSLAINSNRAIQCLERRDIEEHLFCFLVYTTETEMTMIPFVLVINFIIFCKTLQGKCRPMEPLPYACTE